MVAGGLIEQKCGSSRRYGHDGLAMHENVRELNSELGGLNLRIGLHRQCHCRRHCIRKFFTTSGVTREHGKPARVAGGARSDSRQRTVFERLQGRFASRREND